MPEIPDPCTPIPQDHKTPVPPGGWRGGRQPKWEPLEVSELGLRDRLVLQQMLRSGTAHCPHLYRTLLRNSRVFRAFLKFNATVMPGGQLTRRQTEIAILRVAWKTRCYYEWSQHVDIGTRAGLTAEDIIKVARGGELGGWVDPECAILEGVDEWVDDHVISSGVWERLAKHFDESLLIEFTLMVGGYVALAGVLNSVGVQLERQVGQAVEAVFSDV